MERVPLDVVRLIAAHLPPAALAALAASCRSYRFLAKEGKLWLPHLERTFPWHMGIIAGAPAAAFRRFAAQRRRMAKRAAPEVQTRSLASIHNLNAVCLLRRPNVYGLIADRSLWLLEDTSRSQTTFTAHRLVESTSSTLAPQAKMSVASGDVLWAALGSTVVACDLDRWKPVLTKPGHHVIMGLQHSIDEPVVVYTSFGPEPVQLMDARAPHQNVATIRVSFPLDAAVTSERVYVCHERKLSVYDRRAPHRAMDEFLHRQTVRNVRLHPANPSVVFTSTHGESLMQRDCAVRAFDASTGKLRGAALDFTSAVRSLSACGDFAIAIGQKEHAKLISTSGEELFHVNGHFIDCDVEYGRAVLLDGAKSELMVLQW